MKLVPTSRLVLSLLLAACANSARPQTPSQPLSPLERLRAASENTALDTPGSLPWHLKLTVTLTKDQPLEGPGTLEEWWTDPDHYRITYDFPAYKATLLQQGDTTFHTPSVPPPPFQLHLLLTQAFLKHC